MRRVEDGSVSGAVRGDGYDLNDKKMHQVEKI